jgi:hypothetical protein
MILKKIKPASMAGLVKSFCSGIDIPIIILEDDYIVISRMACFLDPPSSFGGT